MAGAAGAGRGAQWQVLPRPRSRLGGVGRRAELSHGGSNPTVCQARPGSPTSALCPPALRSPPSAGVVTGQPGGAPLASGRTPRPKEARADARVQDGHALHLKGGRPVAAGWAGDRGICLRARPPWARPDVDQAESTQGLHGSPPCSRQYRRGTERPTARGFLLLSVPRWYSSSWYHGDTLRARNPRPQVAH